LNRLCNTELVHHIGDALDTDLVDGGGLDVVSGVERLDHHC
jgi:hypothetical protein